MVLRRPRFIKDKRRPDITSRYKAHSIKKNISTEGLRAPAEHGVECVEVLMHAIANRPIDELYIVRGKHVPTLRECFRIETLFVELYIMRGNVIQL